MYTLITTVISLTGIGLFFCSASPLTAQKFCAVTLHVTAFNDKPITSTWVELDDSSGKVVQRQMMQGATLQICDFGFGPHVLRVGTNECLPVTISNIKLVLGSPLDLRVVLNGCGYRETMRNACLVYFRVADARGEPVPEAEFSPRLTSQAPRTDSYGRYQGLFSGSHDLTFVAAGFEATTTHVQCGGTEDVDQVVVMRRTR